MKLFPYLKMHGNARQAVSKYKQIFNGTIERFSEYKNSPLANETNSHLIIHCQLHFMGNTICLADMISKEQSDQAKHQANDQLYQLCLNFDSDQLPNAQRIFKELSENGEVLMKFEKTFWHAYYGKVKDAFGIIWGLNCSIEEEKIEEKSAQANNQKQTKHEESSSKSSKKQNI